MCASLLLRRRSATDGIVDAEQTSRSIVQEFAERLPGILEVLYSDVRAAYDGDPSAKSLDEVLLSYPGIKAIIHHRLAHALYKLDLPIIARIIAEHSHSATGIDIHPGAEIGGSFFIDHGTGVVIGETAVIGERVRVYQAVTLGAKRFSVDENGALGERSAAPSDRPGRRRHLRGGDHSRTGHDWTRISHRRQCLADAERGSRQQHRASASP